MIIYDNSKTYPVALGIYCKSLLYQLARNTDTHQKTSLPNTHDNLITQYLMMCQFCKSALFLSSYSGTNYQWLLSKLKNLNYTEFILVNDIQTFK